MVYFVFNYANKNKSAKLAKSLSSNNEAESHRKSKIKFISIPGKSLVENK